MLVVGNVDQQQLPELLHSWSVWTKFGGNMPHLAMLNEMTLLNNKISGACERVKPIEVPDEEYDFVVIGGGGAGAVAVGRLSENPEMRVLLIEAGPDEPAGAQIPLFTDFLIGTRTDWNYTSTNESHACLNAKGKCSIPGGKMLGGGTAHYGMVYIRGNPTDYNNWAAMGNEGWTWEEVKPFYLKAEDNGQIEKFGTTYHATGGPLSVEQFPYLPPFGRSILKASEQIGYGVTEDFNGQQLTGFGIAQTTSKDGVRRSSSSSYLWPARDRKNLHVTVESHVTRIIVKNKRAVGVEYIKDDKLKTVRIKKEVVLSAGAIESPKILLLSGIGPKKHLNEMGIDVVKELPGVGENVHDHATQVLNFSINDTDYYDNDYDIAAEYLTKRTGPLSCNGLAQVMAPLNSTNTSSEYPDLQLYFNGYSSACAPGENHALHSHGKRKLNLRAVNLRPRSREMSISCSSSNSCIPGQYGPSIAEMCNTSQFVLFLTMINEMARLDNKISGVCERVKPIEEPDEEYDFVVIGGGGAGAVAAGRLSENPKMKTLVLEAGPDEPAAGQIPLFVYSLLRTRVDWNFTSTNERHACLKLNGRCPITAGKMLGGGTAHYGMIYIRGNPTDYNNWAALGNEGWTWEEVKRFYLKAENNGQIKKFGTTYHATGGPLSVEQLPYLPPFGRSILKASEQAGYGVTEDFNGEQLTGFGIAQTTSKDGVRRSSSSSYLWPARNRENLHVSLESHVNRIIVKNKRAVGVEFIKDGKVRRVRVSKEVVLSAGTIQSPKILLLSGIGPKEHMKKMGIDVVKELPGVGENLHDHVTQVLRFSINETDYYDNDYKIAAEYFTKRTGPLSCNGLAQVMATLKSVQASSEYPDLQVYFNGYSSACAPGENHALHSSGKRTIVIRAVNLRPRSRGRITLASKDPLVYPNIWVNYLNDPRDVDGLVQAINLGLRMQDTEAMRAHNFTFIDEPEEACSNYTFLSDNYWRCAVRQDGIAEVHLAGSCKMGNSTDPMAVVDPRLRVYGIKGLRVVDTSIMPQVTSGNTGAPSMMIGERGADFIKQDWAL